MPLAGGIVLRAAAPVIGNAVRQAGIQLANTVLANPAAAGRAVLAATGLIAAANNASRQTQQQIRQTERKIARPNQSPEQMAAYQAQLAEQQALLNDIQQVMQNAKDKQEQAEEKANEADDAQDQTGNKCGNQSKDCLQKHKCKPVHKIEWTKRGFDVRKHFKKHGPEFGLGKKDESVYLRMALEFALTAIPGAKEVTAGNNITIKYDPASNQFFQGHKGRGEIGTFYKPANPQTAWEEGLETAKKKAQSDEITEHTCD